MAVQLPYHHRNNYTGNGLANVFKTVSNVIRPLFNASKTLLKPATKHLGREGLSLIASTAEDVLKGKPLKKSLKDNVKKSKKRIKKKIKQKLTKGSGSKKRKTKTKTKKIHSKKKSGKKATKKTTSKKKTAAKKSIFDGYDL